MKNKYEIVKKIFTPLFEKHGFNYEKGADGIFYRFGTTHKHYFNFFFSPRGIGLRATFFHPNIKSEVAINEVISYPPKIEFFGGIKMDFDTKEEYIGLLEKTHEILESWLVHALIDENHSFWANFQTQFKSFIELMNSEHKPTATDRFNISRAVSNLRFKPERFAHLIDEMKD